MRSKTVRLLIIALLLLTAAVASRPAIAQSGNLLQNPSFEGGYSAYRPQTAQEHTDCPSGICNTAQVPAGWRPWWAKEWATDVNPEYKPATQPFANRIHSGDRAAQYFSFHSTHKAGFLQQVSVPANATVQFTIWGQAWVSNEDSGGSDASNPINMRIGIDPTGGTNPYSGNVVWSGTLHPYDAYQQFSVQAQAQGSTVTVFTYSAPSFPFKHNDVYWDDAALVVVGAGTPSPAPAPAPAPAPSTGADGTYTVVAGDTMYGIARRFGVDFEVLVGVNNISNPSLIRVGQVLTIPGGGQPAPPPSAETPPGSGPVAVTQVNLRLRSGPGIEHQTLTVAPAGTSVAAIGRNQATNWIQVQYAGQTGWMAGWFLNFSSGSAAALPVTSP
ncbi:MAG: LysM peptidoglycan-binding domain-containing protein [Anaerolineae bacterium]|nr:LysM peptidoglycan-binding domain-containing protein [Anaerolineae bacterium]